MKVVSVTIVAASGKKASKKLNLLPLATVAQYIKDAPSFLTEGLEKDLKKIKKNTTYTFDPVEGVTTVSVDNVVDKGKMKLARFDEDKITFHNLQVYSYEGKMYGLEKDFDEVFDL